MTKIGGILLCLVIVSLDVAAAILGIQAEVAQNQVLYIHKHILLSIKCFSPQSMMIMMVAYRTVSNYL